MVPIDKNITVETRFNNVVEMLKELCGIAKEKDFLLDVIQMLECREAFSSKEFEKKKDGIYNNSQPFKTAISSRQVVPDNQYRGAIFYHNYYINQAACFACSFAAHYKKTEESQSPEMLNSNFKRYKSLYNLCVSYRASTYRAMYEERLQKGEVKEKWAMKCRNGEELYQFKMMEYELPE
jgi:hypothetical protein